MESGNRGIGFEIGGPEKEGQRRRPTNKPINSRQRTEKMNNKKYITNKQS